MCRMTGNQVVHSILGPATYLLQRFGPEIISTVIFSLTLIRVGHVIYWRKYGRLGLVNHLQSLHRNSVDRLND